MNSIDKKKKKNDYINSYKKENVKTYKISINKKKYPELIEFIDSLENKNQYFLKLLEDSFIRRDDE